MLNIRNKYKMEEHGKIVESNDVHKRRDLKVSVDEGNDFEIEVELDTSNLKEGYSMEDLKAVIKSQVEGDIIKLEDDILRQKMLNKRDKRSKKELIKKEYELEKIKMLMKDMMESENILTNMNEKDSK